MSKNDGIKLLQHIVFPGAGCSMVGQSGPASDRPTQNMTTGTRRRAGGAKRIGRTPGRSRNRTLPAITERRIDELRPYEGNARTHSRRQIRQIADSIDRFGFTNPVLIADDDTIIAGHGRVLAAKQLGMRQVPTVRLSHMNEAERRAAGPTSWPTTSSRSTRAGTRTCWRSSCKPWSISTSMSS